MVAGHRRVGFDGAEQKVRRRKILQHPVGRAVVELALLIGIALRSAVCQRRAAARHKTVDAFDIGVRSGPEEGAGLISQALIADERLPACSPALLRQQPIRTVANLTKHTLLHSASTRGAWALWLAQAGEPRLSPARNLEFEHMFLQQAAALEGLGVTLASLALIERDLAAGRLVCPISGPPLRAPDYTVVVPAERVEVPAIEAFRNWMLQAGTPPETWRKA